MCEPLYDPLRAAVPSDGPVPVAILGATGSIGLQTIDLALRLPGTLRVVGLSAHTRVAELSDLVGKLREADPGLRPAIAVSDPTAHAAAARDPLLEGDLLPAGKAGLRELAALSEAEVIVNGLVGAAGLEPTLAAAAAGKRLALANKESLVIGGDLVRRAMRAGGSVIVPVDSEHSALAQCLIGRRPEEVERLILTASGGPFRTLDREALRNVTRAQVLDHPTWDMGPKITVDSATLMNKGLEIIEAHVLFGLPYERIAVLVHPGSTVHSLVEFVDGGLMAQLGLPDMRLPILYAIADERHRPLPGDRLDLAAAADLHFEAPDPVRFPCLDLARRAGMAGGRAPIVLNAANEEAVARLLDDRLSYADIAVVIEETLATVSQGPVHDLAAALATDAEARTVAAATADRLADPRD